MCLAIIGLEHCWASFNVRQWRDSDDRGGGPRVVVSTAAFHARVRGFGSRSRRFERNKKCDREVACSASDRQGSNFESCVWRTVSSQSSHHPQEVLLARFSLYVHKGGLKPDSFHFSDGRLYMYTPNQVPAYIAYRASIQNNIHEAFSQC